MFIMKFSVSFCQQLSYLLELSQVTEHIVAHQLVKLIEKVYNMGH